MPTDRLPPFLQDEAHNLRVTWGKALNYFASFTTQWMELKRRFERGEFDHRRSELKFGGTCFGAWTGEVGLPDAFINKLLKMHELALAEEHRNALNREISLRKQEQRKAKLQDEIDKNNKKVKRKQDSVAAINQTRVEEIRQKRKETRTEKARLISQHGPRHPELRALLEASAYLRQRKPIDRILLGHCYCDMWTLLDQPAVCAGEGKDYDGNLISWGRFIILHIVNSPDPQIRNTKAAVEKLVKQYTASVPAGQEMVPLTRNERRLLTRHRQAEEIDDTRTVTQNRTNEGIYRWPA
jgi:hypothetical protein